MLHLTAARRAWAAALLALFLPLLSGCGRSAGVPPLTPKLLAATFDYSSHAPSDGRVHISYWEKWTGFEADAMRAVVEAFNASQNRVFVHMLTISQVDQKMLLATAGGNPPDVAGLWAYNVNVFAEKNALRPLDPLIREAGIKPSDYIPCYWELGQYRGTMWAMPSAPATVALHWNRRMFRAAGLDPDRPPRTIQELDDYAKRLTKKDAAGNITQAGFMQAEPGWWNFGWGYWFGGRLWDGRSRITANSPENLRAYRWVQSYATAFGPSALQVFKSGFGNFSSPQNAFINEKVAMVLQGVWMYNFIDKYNSKLDWAAAPFPYPADRPDLGFMSAVDMDVLTIPSGARHPREAWEFIRYVQSPKGMELLCLGQRKHSPLAKVSPEFWVKHPNPYIKLFTRLAWSKNTWHTPRIGVWRQYNDEMNAAFDSIWLGTTTPEQALGDVQQRIQRKFDGELLRMAQRGRSYDEHEASRS